MVPEAVVVVVIDLNTIVLADNSSHRFRVDRYYSNSLHLFAAK
jgi:hypothetical protein